MHVSPTHWHFVPLPLISLLPIFSLSLLPQYLCTLHLTTYFIVGLFLLSPLLFLSNPVENCIILVAFPVVLFLITAFKNIM